VPPKKTQPKTTTKGVSPKVRNPALVLLVVGLALLGIALLVSDDELRTIGLSAIGSAVAAAGVGYAAPPGETVSAGTSYRRPR
jgi:hypothetical protein